MDLNDTIAAISTGLTPSGIGIVRISGEASVEKADLIFKSASENVKLSLVPSHTIHYGYIYDGDELIDEVLVSVFRAPKSFTAEDTVEINCHGGIYTLQRVFQSVINTGVRPADPGEFSKRAFLNGRIDLTQAEAVMDVISSKNDMALKNSLSQLKGSVKNAISALRESILYESARIESALDDPEHYSLDGYDSLLEEKLEGWMKTLKHYLDTADNGKIIREGVNVSIVGKPNAGKSSLLNVLVGQERAIVTQVPGTTRDILSEEIRLDGISLNLFDTAGIHETEDVVEKIGVDKAVENLGNADLILHVIDSSNVLSDEDDALMELIAGKKQIVLLNKSDMDEKTGREDVAARIGAVYEKLHSLENTDISEAALLSIPAIISISALDETGIEKLLSEIKSMFVKGDISVNDEVMITNLRQKKYLEDALNSLLRVKDSIDACVGEDFYTIDMMAAYDSLGMITGEKCSEDLVDEIFDRFCMGK